MRLIPDGSELVGIQKAVDIKYMRLVRFGLRMIGTWPDRGNDSRFMIIKRHFIFVMETFTLITGILYLKFNVGKLTFFILGHTYITVFMNVIGVSRLGLIYLDRYHELTDIFLTRVHLFNHKDKSDYAMKTHILVHKISHFFTLYLNVSMVGGIILFSATPLYNNIMSGAFNNPRPENATFQHAVYYALPFDYTTSLRGFLVLYTCNLYITSVCSCCICIFDLLLSLMVFHLWGHYKILINSLENFPIPSNGAISFSEEESKGIHLKLQETIRHHNLIIDFTSKMSSTFGWVLLLYYAFHQVSGCLLLLQCSKLEPQVIARYGPLTVILFQQLIQISYVFELLGTMNDKLPDAVYSVPWECMPLNTRKLVLVFLIQAQKPMHIKAMSMVSVGVQTMAAILKTSVSYFVMLRTIATE
uniref:Odorant receptor n=1 Tax=Antheraea pernyi TaxID=7119 RepID=D3H5T3_ANTPE|nr:olfactory receptor 1 [Antheraea pernyi]